MSNIIKPPPPEVIQAFGGQGQVKKLPGGEGQSFKVGNLVFKPVENAAQSRWIAQTLSNIKSHAFRLSHPVTSNHGDIIHQGWQVFEYLEGKAVKGRWEEKISISRKIHQKLTHIHKPKFIGHRKNLWEKADLAVWQEVPLIFDSQLRHITDRLTSMLQPLNTTNQLIHGDMTGNFLFHTFLPPAVIDFSPYWRPKEYPTAIIIVDAIVWEQAEDSLMNALVNTPDNNQLLLRAALWRIKTTELFSQIYKTNPLKEINQYRHFCDLITSRIQKI